MRGFILLQLFCFSSAITMKPATTSHATAIRSSVFRERMNPLGLDIANFVVACEADDDIVACGQVRKLPGTREDYELASLIVVPAQRKKGFGSMLVRELLRVRVPKSASVYVTTPTRTSDFYEKLGFQKINEDEAPLPLRFEMGIGRFVVSVITGDSLVCLKHNRTRQ